MPTEPLRPHENRELRRLQIHMRKHGGDGNDLTVTNHRDGTVTIRGKGRDGKNRTATAANLADAAAALAAAARADIRVRRSRPQDT